MTFSAFYANTVGTIACDDHRPLLGGIKWILEGWRPLTAMDAECARALAIGCGRMRADEPLCQMCRERRRETARPMTMEQALARARELWPGERVEVARDPVLNVCAVGRPGPDYVRLAGFGPTWEAAFADAARRERGQS